MPQPNRRLNTLIGMAVNVLLSAENKMRRINTPIIAMTAPTTSSLRSGVRVSHQGTETGSGVECGADFPLLGVAFPASFPRAGAGVLPFVGFAPDFLEEEVGVLRGITLVGV